MFPDDEPPEVLDEVEYDNVGKPCFSCYAFVQADEVPPAGLCKLHAPTVDTKGDSYAARWPVVDGTQPCCRAFRPKGRRLNLPRG